MTTNHINTFSQEAVTPQAPVLSAGAPRTSSLIESLPTELLAIILEHVYSTLHSDHVCYSYPSSLPSYACFTQCSLFLDAITSVSKRWRDVAESVPMFWSHIIIFIDRHPTPLSIVRSYFKNSRQLPLDVTVARRSTSDDEADPGEYSRCRNVIEIMMPHLQQCERICFDVINSSSLPSIVRDFRGPAPILSILQLNCRRDDGIPPGDRAKNVTQPPHQVPFSCPELVLIEIDGRNFAYASLDLPSWRESLNRPKDSKALIAISVSNFSPTRSNIKDHDFTLFDFWTLVAITPLITKLTLSNVKFPHAKDDLRTFPSSPSLSHIVFKDLDDDFLYSLSTRLNYNALDVVSIERCPLISAVPPQCAHLILSEIEEWDAIDEFLGEWNGDSLTVNDCPYFDDELLQALGEVRDMFQLLEIQNCCGFSAQGLKQMMERINENISDGLRAGPISIHTLKVTGRGPEPPSDEELEWFRSNVVQLTWDAKQNDGSVAEIYRSGGQTD